MQTVLSFGSAFQITLQAYTLDAIFVWYVCGAWNVYLSVDSNVRSMKFFWGRLLEHFALGP